jgi:hypothetical protein
LGEIDLRLGLESSPCRCCYCYAKLMGSRTHIRGNWFAFAGQEPEYVYYVPILEYVSVSITNLHDFGGEMEIPPPRCWELAGVDVAHTTDQVFNVSRVITLHCDLSHV